jgi:predicted lipid-binding transport protein (Tim44 family)
MQEATETGSVLSAILLFLDWWVLLTLCNFVLWRDDKPAPTAAALVQGNKAPDGQPAGGEIYPGFDKQEFLNGAANAYETILRAYAACDFATLRALLAQDVFDVFETAITERLARSEKLQLIFICLKDVQIARANLGGNNVEITVHFAAHLFSATLSSNGKVIDGDPTRVIETADLWTFGRDISQAKSTWLLVATDNGAHLQAEMTAG